MFTKEQKNILDAMGILENVCTHNLSDAARLTLLHARAHLSDRLIASRGLVLRYVA